MPARLSMRLGAALPGPVANGIGDRVRAGGAIFADGATVRLHTTTARMRNAGQRIAVLDADMGAPARRVYSAAAARAARNCAAASAGGRSAASHGATSVSTMRR